MLREHDLPLPGRVAPLRRPGAPARLARRLRARAASIPAAAWLVEIVVVAALFRLAAARAIPGPWVFPDELVYSELAKSIGGGGLAIRDTPVAAGAYGVVYPLLLAPAFRLSGSVTTAYEVAKALNAVVMTSAAVPAYLVARRLLPERRALLAAVAAVAAPSLVYTGTLMTENVFYPLFLWAALALVRALERPTPGRQLALLLALGLAVATRAQGVALVPAALTAIAGCALLDARAAGEAGIRGAARRMRAMWPSVGTLLAAPAALLAVEAARGRSPVDTAGPYGNALHDVSAAAVPGWVLTHLSELDLYVAAAPLAAGALLLAHVARDRAADRPLRVFAVVSGSLCGWTILTAATFATVPFDPPRVQERYVFYATPLLVIALLERLHAPRPRRRILLPVVAAAAVLPAAMPLGRLLDPVAHASSVALIPWLAVDPAAARIGMVLLCSLGAAALLLPGRAARVAAPAFVLANLFVLAVAANASFVARSEYRMRVGTAADPGWIDRAVGRDADVTVLWEGERTRAWEGRFTVWENEVFNRSVHRLVFLREPLDGMPQRRSVVDPASGRLLVWRTGRPLQASYVLASRELPVVGREVVADAPTGMTLWRVDGTVRVRPAAVCRRTHVWYATGRCAGTAERLPPPRVAAG